MKDVYINGNRVSIKPDASIGKGTEADVYSIGGGKALKLFKTPDHPDYSGIPSEQEGARRRIKEHQLKLLDFPKNLPQKVIKPEQLATDKSGKLIVGYTMQMLRNAENLMRYSEKSFRQKGIDNNIVLKIFLDLHKTLQEVHRAGVIVGDFNDLNVLISKQEAYLIDSDSFQFGSFLCQMFTAKFVDPLLCDPRAKALMLAKPYISESDWYAFTVMLMQSLLFANPYDGIYKPKDETKRMPQCTRPLHRITVFNPEVKYPKPAIPYKVLPDDLLHYFSSVFEKDLRQPFPAELLQNTRWTKCLVCGLEHARNKCPGCNNIEPSTMKPVVKISGNVKSLNVFHTHGLILAAHFEGNKLCYLYNQDGKFVREDGREITSGHLDNGMRFRICGKKTLIAKNGNLLVFNPSGEMTQEVVDSYGNLPIFDANSENYFWSNNGQLFRNGKFGQDYIGDVLRNQTLFWAGSEFGFGFYRAGNIYIAFTFDSKRRGINDEVKIPPIRGQLIDATCFFSSGYCWFFVASKFSGSIINQCMVIDQNGKLVASSEAKAGDGSWLSGIRGKCAFGKSLFAATDEGIVRVEVDNSAIVLTREFNETEKFVDSSKQIFASRDGIYVVGSRTINLLTIS